MRMIWFLSVWFDWTMRWFAGCMHPTCLLMLLCTVGWGESNLQTKWVSLTRQVENQLQSWAKCNRHGCHDQWWDDAVIYRLHPVTHLLCTCCESYKVGRIQSAKLDAYNLRTKGLSLHPHCKFICKGELPIAIGMGVMRMIWFADCMGQNFFTNVVQSWANSTCKPIVYHYILNSNSSPKLRNCNLWAWVWWEGFG